MPHCVAQMMPQQSSPIGLAAWMRRPTRFTSASISSGVLRREDVISLRQGGGGSSSVKGSAARAPHGSRLEAYKHLGSTCDTTALAQVTQSVSATRILAGWGRGGHFFLSSKAQRGSLAQQLRRALGRSQAAVDAPVGEAAAKRLHPLVHGL